MHIGRIRTGAILISVGIVLLLNTTGQLPWMVWWRIISLWPIALVAIGIELLFKKTSLSILSIISPILFIIAILGPALIFKEDFSQIHRAGETYFWSQDLDTTLTKVNASVEISAGDLKISSGADQLISAELDYWDKEPIVDYKKIASDNSATIEIQDQGRTRRGWNWGWARIWWGENEKKDWDIKLSDRFPLNLNIDAKADRIRLDLSDLRLTNLKMDSKASHVDITIGDLVDNVTGRITSKASTLYLSFPEDMALRIENRAKMSTTSFSHISLREIEDGYETPDFANAPRKLTLYLDGSVTKLRINQYRTAEGI
jgi:hypothetical protein